MTGCFVACTEWTTERVIKKQKSGLIEDFPLIQVSAPPRLLT